MTKTVMVLDIDMTLADHTHRAHLLQDFCSACGCASTITTCNKDGSSSKNCMMCDCDVFVTPKASWIAFCQPDLMMKDVPFKKAQAVVAKAMTKDSIDVHFITGRADSDRELTEEWLKAHYGFSPVFNSLYMRAGNSYTDRNVVHTPASVHKRWCFTKLCADRGYTGSETFMFFDDDRHVIDMYSEFGFVFKAPECWDIMSPDKQTAQEKLRSK